MSVKCMSQVWDLKLPPSQKIVLLKLADNANDQGLCWPSLGNVADLCCLSIRTVQGCISDLEAEGLISREMIPGKVTRYRLHLDVTPAFPALVQNLRGCKPPQPTPAKPAGVPPQSATSPYIEEPSIEPSIEPSTPAREISKFDVDQEFHDRFWPSVPNKSGKLRAQAAFHEARRIAPLSTILAGLTGWAAAAKAEDKSSGFTPHSNRLPSNWLDEQRWTDEGTAIQTTPGVAIDPAEDARQNAADEAALPALWAKSPLRAGAMQVTLEYRLHGRLIDWDLKARAESLRDEFARTGRPPVIKRPQGDARAGPTERRRVG